jgi:hypothetical protein
MNAPVLLYLPYSLTHFAFGTFCSIGTEI